MYIAAWNSSRLFQGTYDTYIIFGCSGQNDIGDHQGFGDLSSIDSKEKDSTAGKLRKRNCSDCLKII